MAQIGVSVPVLQETYSVRGWAPALNKAWSLNCCSDCSNKRVVTEQFKTRAEHSQGIQKIKTNKGRSAAYESW
jgi:hypothetical protein